MGVTIQFESHRNELAFIYGYEVKKTVMEYYDQPAPIKIRYKSKNGRPVAFYHTPDFFVISADSAGWVECKTEPELIELAEAMPNRYCQSEDGGWRCIPGEQVADPLGLYYLVRSDKEINSTFLRNILFFEDYFRSGELTANSVAREAVLKLLSSERQISLSELSRLTKEFASQDDINLMIATGEVFVDLSSAPLVQASNVQVFLNEDIATAYGSVSEASARTTEPAPKVINLVVGGGVMWDNRAWWIVNVGDKHIELLGDGDISARLPVNIFEERMREGVITVAARNDGVPSTHPEARKMLAEATLEDFRIANQRLELIRAYENGIDVAGGKVKTRTVRSYFTKFRKAEAKYGIGYVGLIPQTKKRGNRRSKLPEEIYKLTIEFIEEKYETIKQMKKRAVYSLLFEACEKRGFTAPSYKTFIKILKKRPKHQQAAKRQGRRAAYKDAPFYWRLERTTPRHGDRPFEIGHIDETLIDTELLCSDTEKNLGRAWWTLMVDAYSRRVLGSYVSYEAPSRRSALMVLRDCVRRYGRLPQIVVVDNAPHFNSTDFEKLLARYECTKKSRPPAEPRYGSICERLFGTANSQVIHNLIGNTQIMRNPRQATRSVNPKNLALWTLERLYLRLCEWSFEVYDNTEHITLGQSPRDAFLSGLARTGLRAHKIIPYEDDFLMFTMPTTRKGTAKVYTGKGFKSNHTWYWDSALDDPALDGKSIPVRPDPWNAGIAYGFTGTRWTACKSQYFMTFNGRSLQEIMIASEELRRRQLLHSKNFSISARKLADFLESLEAEELLLFQRLKDKEHRKVLKHFIDSRTPDEPEHEEQRTRPYRADRLTASTDQIRSGDGDDDTPLEVLKEY